MLRLFLSAAFAAACAFPASAATLAAFETDVVVRIQSDPAEELLFRGGFLPAPSTSTVTGDAVLTTGDDGRPTTCCGTGTPVPGTLTDIGNAGLSASGEVFGIGSIDAFGQRRAVLEIGNFGADVETVTVEFLVSAMQSTVIDPAIGGTAISQTDVNIQQNGTTIFDREILTGDPSVSGSQSFFEIVRASFDVPPTDDYNSDFRISIVGTVVMAAPDPSPIPLPASGALLLLGLPLLAAIRRRHGGLSAGGA